MGIRQTVGDEGEREVVANVDCPNCGKHLMALPKNYPLYDVQCTACSFRAQVKTASSPPRDSVFGAGWEIMSKVLKSGFLVPPTIVNFKWTHEGQPRQEIRFYPFVPRENLRSYQLSSTARRANYKMFSYQGLLALPHFVLFSSQGSRKEGARGTPTVDKSLGKNPMGTRRIALRRGPSSESKDPPERTTAVGA